MSSPTQASGPPNRRALTFVVAPLIVLVIASWLGDALAPTLVPDPNNPDRSSNPVLLLILSPRLRNQVAVVNYVEPVLFYVIGTLRLLAADPPFYLLGLWYGDSALRWMERRSPTAGRIARESEGLYKVAAYPLVAIAPNNLICLLAGASRMRPAVFFTLNIGGTLVRLWLVVRFGEAFEDQINTVLGWVGQYRFYLLALSITVVAVFAWRQLRSEGSEIGQLRRLESDMEDDE